MVSYVTWAHHDMRRPRRPAQMVLVTSFIVVILVVITSTEAIREGSSGGGEERAPSRHFRFRAGAIHNKLNARAWFKQPLRPGGAPAGSDEACDSALGLPWINAWQADNYTLCRPASGASSSRSSVLCFGHGSNGSAATHTHTAVCLSSNLVLDSRAFMGDSRQLMHPKGDHHLVKPAGAAGSVRADCQLDMQLLPAIASANLDPWFRSALKNDGAAAAASSVSAACQDPTRTVKHPVMFLLRSDSTSMYHHWEDAVALLVNLRMMPELQRAVTRHGMEVVFTDFLWPGKFLDFWQRLSSPYRLRFLRDDPFPDGTCFKLALHSPMVHNKILYSSVLGKIQHCTSPIMMAASLWLQGIYPELQPKAMQPEHIPTYSASQQRSDSIALSTHGIVRMNLVWMSRRAYEATNAGKLTSWQSSRLMTHEDALVLALHNFTLAWNGRNCMMASRSGAAAEGEGCRTSPLLFDFVVLEGSDMSLHDQVHLMMRTALIVGVHGAALTSQLFMPQGCRSVLELHVSSHGNYHYQNLASYLGSWHESTPWTSAADIPGVLHQLEKLLVHIDGSAEACAEHMRVSLT